MTAATGKATRRAHHWFVLPWAMLVLGIPASLLLFSLIQDAVEDADVRDYAARTDAATKDSSFGSLADKLRGALGRDE